jgi:hypothetical protein
MDTYQMRVFQRHLRDQCLFLLAAADDIDTGLNAQNNIEVFFGIQNLLNAGANISKLLWGQKGRFAESRKQLRDSIGISDDSPLREVSMRNHFEHMDERIDRWWAESSRHNTADLIIGPRTVISGLEPIETFRWFDPVSKEVIFWGEGFNIRSLLSEVARILPKLQQEACKPHWNASEL